MPRFGSDKPRIAVAGLNPHASEGGLFGNQEAEQIIPAIEDARAANLIVDGPHPLERNRRVAEDAGHLGSASERGADLG